MKNLEQLWALQELELEKLKLVEDKGIEDEALIVQQMITGFKKLADSMRPMAETYKKNQTVLEELHQTQGRLEKQIHEAENTLYKGDENNSKTLQSIQEEIHTLLEKLGPTTDQIKVLEQQRKEAQRHLQTLNLMAERRKLEIHESKKHLNLHKTENDEKVKSLDHKITTIRKGIDVNSLKKYDELKKRRMPVIVESSNGVCKGCNMQVSMVMSQFITQREGDDSQTLICENCGRILYIRDDITIVAP